MRPPSLYKYFPSKAALYDALYAEGVRLIRESDARIWAAYPPGWEGIEAWFRSRLVLACAHRELYELVTSSPVPGFEPSAANLDAAFATGALLQRAVEEATAAGVIAPGMEPIDPDTDRAEGALGDCLSLLRTAWTPQRSRDGPR